VLLFVEKMCRKEWLVLVQIRKVMRLRKVGPGSPLHVLFVIFLIYLIIKQIIIKIYIFFKK
jgi:hypothetical protein